MQPLRETVFLRLKESLPGRNLYDLALTNGVTIVTADGKINKGWVGQTIERVAGLEINNRKGPDGADFELKSTTVFYRDGWVPKETIKVAQLNASEILEETFETSALWKKLSRLLFVGCYHEAPDRCVPVCLGSIDIVDPKIVGEIQTLWEDIRHTVLEGEMPRYANFGTADDLVQLRPTGDGKGWSVCPITGEKFPARAFYATKRLLKEILGASEVLNDRADSPAPEPIERA